MPFEQKVSKIIPSLLNTTYGHQKLCTAVVVFGTKKINKFYFIFKMTSLAR